MVTKEKLKNYNYRKWLPKSFRWAALEFIIFIIQIALLLAALLSNDLQVASVILVFVIMWHRVGTLTTQNHICINMIDDYNDVIKIVCATSNKENLQKIDTKIKNWQKEHSRIGIEKKRFNEKS